MDPKWRAPPPLATSQIPLVWVTRELGSQPFDFDLAKCLSVALERRLLTRIFLKAPKYAVGVFRIDLH
jgi:hypothetical protein